MYYQIYDTQHDKVVITVPTLEDAQAFLRLYELGERAYHTIRPIFKEEHPLRANPFYRY